MTCPFCNDKDFDEVGLKHHLSAGHCARYNVTAGVDRLPRRLTTTHGGQKPRRDEHDNGILMP